MLTERLSPSARAAPPRAWRAAWTSSSRVATARASACSRSRRTCIPRGFVLVTSASRSSSRRRSPSSSRRSATSSAAYHSVSSGNVMSSLSRRGYQRGGGRGAGGIRVGVGRQQLAELESGREPRLEPPGGGLLVHLAVLLGRGEGPDHEVVPAVPVEVRVQLERRHPRGLGDLLARGHPLEEVQLAPRRDLVDSDSRLCRLVRVLVPPRRGQEERGKGDQRQSGLAIHGNL